MGDEDDRLVQRAPQREQIVVQAKPRDFVERRERLVHQKNIRVGDEGPRQRDPHLHAAGQFTRESVGKFGESDLCKHVGDPPVRLSCGRIGKLQRQSNVIAHGRPRHQRGLLEHKAYGMPPIRFARLMGDVHRA